MKKILALTTCISTCLLSLLLGQLPSWAQTCNPYRTGYEKAIAQGIIKRAPLVSGPTDAYYAFQQALERGDRIDVAIRASQYLVIVSESSGNRNADIERLDLENVMVNHFQKPVEVSVPMLSVILPPNVFCPIN